MTTRVLQFAFLWLIALGTAGCASETKTYVYSDVRHIAEVDDVVGNEIVVKIQPGESTVVGQWDLYEGYEPVRVPLKGTVSSGRLSMSGPGSDLRPELEARLSDSRLVGILKWWVGSSEQSKRIQLRRVKGRWEDLRKQSDEFKPRR